MYELDDVLKDLSKEIQVSSSLINRSILIGTNNVKAMVLYIDGLVNRTLINENILKPLLRDVDEYIPISEDTPQYILEKYIPFYKVDVSADTIKAIDGLKNGKTLLYISNIRTFLIFDTNHCSKRAISEPENESSVRGSKESFVENLDLNLSLIKRILKDKNLKSQNFILGSRSETRVTILYLEDLVDDDVLNELVIKINSLRINSLTDSGVLDQYIEDNPYSPFPQNFYTERTDRVKAHLMSGKIAILVDGSPSVLTVPSVFFEFFQSIEDYNERTLVSSLIRFLRLLAVFLKLTLSPFYLALIAHNSELIPLKFIGPIIQSRQGIPLSPFLEILLMEIVIEFLREGSLRMPNKVAQTLSIAGGIIVGQTAVQSQIVSPTTLFVIGVSTIASFLISNYEMSLTIRMLTFPMLILSNSLGLLGISLGLTFLIIHLCSIKNLGVPYLDLYISDLRDILIRAPLYKLKETFKAIPTKLKKE
ncbi:spore germination protein [Clostridium sp.]|uniref:spore germination protein n=1 Tax=Clostridium sp. TaxID=1506 RepID=UPI0034641B88